MPEINPPAPQNDMQYLVYGLVVIVAILTLSPAIIAFVKFKFPKEETIIPKQEHPTDDHECHQSGNLMDLKNRMERMEGNQQRMEKSQEHLAVSQDALEEKIDEFVKDISNKLDQNRKEVREDLDKSRKEVREDLGRVHERIDEMLKIILEKLK
jgi:predicted transcriptional regulator